MSTWLWVVLVIAVVVVALLILATAIRSRRTERLKEGFGPEYDRTVNRTGDRQAAESELRDRQARHDELELRPLAPLARKGFMDAWQGTQAEFVDDPVVAISDADRLIQSVMRDRGLSGRGLRRPRRARLGRPPGRRRALPPGARDRHRERRGRYGHRRTADRDAGLPGAVRGARRRPRRRLIAPRGSC